MSVPSFPFLGFAVLFALLVNLSNRPVWREPVMLLANVSFLASFARSPAAFAPFALFVLGAYVLLELVRRNPKVMLWPGIVVTLLAFFWLKKYSFVPSALFLGIPYVVIGISYITFRILHLVIDTGQGLIKERVRLIDYLNFTLCFPCIVAGPIQMYPDYLEGKTGRPGLTSIGVALERIAIGMFKVFIVSAALDGWHGQTIADALAGHGGAVDAMEVVGLYVIYLYFNFSGYTDVVIGAGRLLGQTLPENFNRPLVAANIIDFWGRWHITLSTWLRTYVFNPFMMTGMRRFPSMDKALSVVAFFLTFFLLQGGGMAINKLYQVLMTNALGRKGYRKLGDQGLYRAVCRGFTFTWYAFTLLWFWSTWKDIGQLWAATGPAAALAALALLWVVSTVALELYTRALDLMDGLPALKPVRASPYLRTMGVAAMVFVTVLAVYVLAAPPPAIVYKAF
jgi:alginate O-acetyltransferase complex protein AlgI